MNTGCTNTQSSFIPDLMEVLKLVLKSNNFKFNDEYYYQILEKAMGKYAASTYATFVTGYLQIKFYWKLNKSFGSTTGKYIEENWFMFLKMCYIALDTKKVDSSTLFIAVFIRISILRWNHLIYIYKITDTQRRVPFTSEHPKHCKTKIPFTLARRICRIGENNKTR